MSLTKNSKIILSSFEDKRYYVNNLESNGYGHPIIRNGNINSSNNNGGGQASPEKGEKRKRLETEAMDLQLKKKKLGMFYNQT